MERHGARGRGARVLDAVRARSLRRGLRADRGDGERGRGHDDIEGRCAGVRLRLPASRGARPRDGDDRRDLRGPPRARARRRVEALGLRRHRHPDGRAQGARRPDDRVHEDRQGAVRRGAGDVPRASTTGSPTCPGTPRPYTPGGPPILIGGGAKRVLRFAGATADIVGLNASIHSGEIDTAAAHDATARPHRREARRGCARARATASTTSRSTRGSSVAKITDDTAGFAAVIAELFSGRRRRTCSARR